MNSLVSAKPAVRIAALFATFYIWRNVRLDSDGFVISQGFPLSFSMLSDSAPSREFSWWLLAINIAIGFVAIVTLLRPRRSESIPHSVFILILMLFLARLNSPLVVNGTAYGGFPLSYQPDCWNGFWCDHIRWITVFIDLLIGITLVQLFQRYLVSSRLQVAGIVGVFEHMGKSEFLASLVLLDELCKLRSRISVSVWSERSRSACA